MKNSAAAIIVLGMALSGCATVIDGSSERIAVATPPARGARCVLSNPRGHWVVTTPGFVNVARSKADMKVRCSKPGYPDITGTIASDIDDWTLVNFLFADLPGLGVDAWSGAINDYNDTNRFGMQQGDGTQQPDSYPSYPDQPPSYPEPAQPNSQQQSSPGTLPPGY